MTDFVEVMGYQGLHCDDSNAFRVTGQTINSANQGYMLEKCRSIRDVAINLSYRITSCDIAEHLATRTRNIDLLASVCLPPFRDK